MLGTASTNFFLQMNATTITNAAVVDVVQLLKMHTNFNKCQKTLSVGSYN